MCSMGGAHHIHWPPLALVVDPSEVFPDDPEGHELDPAQEKNGDHQRWIAFDGVSKDERLNQKVESIQKGH